MQLALNQLAAHLHKGLRPLYTLHGDEALLQQEAADAIRAAARAQGYTERSSFTVAGAHFDWGAVRKACLPTSRFWKSACPRASRAKRAVRRCNSWRKPPLATTAR